MRDGRRLPGLHRDHPGQVSVPPGKPARDAAPEVTEAWEQARHARSPTRICVEHAIADSKNWRALQRWTGRRDDLPETIQAIGSLVSRYVSSQMRHRFLLFPKLPPGTDAA